MVQWKSYRKIWTNGLLPQSSYSSRKSVLWQNANRNIRGWEINLGWKESSPNIIWQTPSQKVGNCQSWSELVHIRGWFTIILMWVMLVVITNQIIRYCWGCTSVKLLLPFIGTYSVFKLLRTLYIGLWRSYVKTDSLDLSVLAGIALSLYNVLRYELFP